MAAADLVCFQTYSCSRHFLSTCVRVCGCVVSIPRDLFLSKCGGCLCLSGGDRGWSLERRGFEG
ncbi:hypothetical protein B0H16DRAFT_1621056 [Mycena metata]|uniref:Uncharacterized protein n=1 Tax=Mycena metata TaxID=1033252 RepID=A0AAD7H6B2_9AGAR|nr:hypothetical protein B0H16DRAFT_1621056 [Mycena metata]